MEHELHALTSFTDPLQPTLLTAWILTSTFLELRIGYFWKWKFWTAFFFKLFPVLSLSSEGHISLHNPQRCYLPHLPSAKLPLSVLPQDDDSHTAGMFITLHFHHFFLYLHICQLVPIHPLSSCIEVVHCWSEVLLLFVCFVCKGLTTTGHL